MIFNNSALKHELFGETMMMGFKCRFNNEKTLKCFLNEKMIATLQIRLLYQQQLGQGVEDTEKSTIKY